MSLELSEQEIIRREKLKSFASMGINAYPADEYVVNAVSTDILANFEKNPSAYQEVSIEGRIMSQRIMGATAFYELQDAEGRIQVYTKEMKYVRAKIKVFIT